MAAAANSSKWNSYYKSTGDYRVLKDVATSQIGMWRANIKLPEHKALAETAEFDISDLVEASKEGMNPNIMQVAIGRFMAFKLTGHQGGICGGFVKPGSFFYDKKLPIVEYNVDTVASMYAGELIRTLQTEVTGKAPKATSKSDRTLKLWTCATGPYKNNFTLYYDADVTKCQSMYTPAKPGDAKFITYEEELRKRLGRESEFTPLIKVPKIVYTKDTKRPMKCRADTNTNAGMSEVSIAIPDAMLHAFIGDFKARVIAPLAQVINPPRERPNQQKKRTSTSKVSSYILGRTRNCHGGRRYKKVSLARTKTSNRRSNGFVNQDTPIRTMNKFMGGFKSVMLGASHEFAKPPVQKRVEAEEKKRNKKTTSTPLTTLNNRAAKIRKLAPTLGPVITAIIEGLKSLNNIANIVTPEFEILKALVDKIATVAPAFVVPEPPRYPWTWSMLCQMLSYGTLVEIDLLKVCNILAKAKPLEGFHYRDSVHCVTPRDEAIAVIMATERRVMGVHQIQFMLNTHCRDVSGILKNYSAGGEYVWSGAPQKDDAAFFVRYTVHEQIFRAPYPGDARAGNNVASLSAIGASSMGCAYKSNPLLRGVNKRIVDLKNLVSDLERSPYIYVEEIWKEIVPDTGETITIATPIMNEISRDIIGAAACQTPGTTSGSSKWAGGEISGALKLQAMKALENGQVGEATLGVLNLWLDGVPTTVISGFNEWLSYPNPKPQAALVLALKDFMIKHGITQEACFLPAGDAKFTGVANVKGCYFDSQSLMVVEGKVDPDDVDMNDAAGQPQASTSAGTV